MSHLILCEKGKNQQGMKHLSIFGLERWERGESSCCAQSSVDFRKIGKLQTTDNEIAIFSVLLLEILAPIQFNWIQFNKYSLSVNTVVWLYAEKKNALSVC